ncbi:unnamed protein product, partial [Discosporangium mesarthrocarpum]
TSSEGYTRSAGAGARTTPRLPPLSSTVALHTPGPIPTPSSGGDGGLSWPPAQVVPLRAQDRSGKGRARKTYGGGMNVGSEGREGSISGPGAGGGGEDGAPRQEETRRTQDARPVKRPRAHAASAGSAAVPRLTFAKKARALAYISNPPPPHPDLPILSQEAKTRLLNSLSEQHLAVKDRKELLQVLQLLRWQGPHPGPPGALVWGDGQGRGTPPSSPTPGPHLAGESTPVGLGNGGPPGDASGSSMCSAPTTPTVAGGGGGVDPGCRGPGSTSALRGGGGRPPRPGSVRSSSNPLRYRSRDLTPRARRRIATAGNTPFPGARDPPTSSPFRPS